MTQVFIACPLLSHDIGCVAGAEKISTVQEAADMIAKQIGSK